MSDFGTVIAGFIPEARAMAESRMFTTGVFQYKTGKTTDPATDADVPVYATAFETKCRIKASALAVQESQAGGRTVAEVTRQLRIPVNSADPFDDPRAASGVSFLVTAVHATDDPTLLGARLTLSGPAPGSQTTDRRYEITEVVR
jgi:hypothetical protein